MVEDEWDCEVEAEDAAEAACEAASADEDVVGAAKDLETGYRRA